MQRREFITLLSSATAWSFSARAQQQPLPVIGFLNSASADGYEPEVDAFRQGLKETGYVEGQNVAIEYRWANGQFDRLAALADDLVRRRVSVIAATSTPANLVAKASTTTIPIVFTTGSDPVQLGLVASLSRPGGNVTGVAQLTREVAPKRLELAHELVPTATVFGLLINPKNPSSENVARDLQAAAVAMGLQLNVLYASTEAEIDDAFTTFRQMHAGALVIGTDVFFNSQMRKLAALAIRNSVIAIYAYHQFVAAGGLASYSSSITDSYRLAGGYVGRILNGEKPADLPVQQATKVELIINLKTAKALGIKVPQSVQSRADEVIE
ncbi:MAG: ABC transporter substrate-binding protein [Bradyrhizobium sp.]|uniref:ABC transporter substrate-binding protein n=1 Tax=Bradyrhizobium sp. TaxID=376 RepID=UPI003C7CBE19